jgi:hypothetical protein
MGQVLGIGSVAEFYPDRGAVMLRIEQRKPVRVVIVGWASVVVDRDMSVVTTTLEPLGNCPECGMAEILVTHLAKAHKRESFWAIAE